MPSNVFFIGYMEFRGRSSRREFWLAMLFFIPVSVLIFLIPAAGTVSGILWMLATMVPIMAISFRRLHDANRTGWWFLLGHVGTILALAMLVVIAFGLVIIEIGMIMVIPHEPPKLDFMTRTASRECCSRCSMSASAWPASR